MSFPASLKPENGPIGSAIATWLDFAPSGVATRFLLLWFVILWTVFQVLSHASTGLDPATLEVYAQGLHPAAGYDLHPPLAGLITAGWFSVFPPTDWTVHLLAMLNAALGLYGVDLIARRYHEGDKRIAVLMILLLTPFYQFYGDRFSWPMTQLSTWPIATYCFLRAFETRGFAWSVRAGAAAGIALAGDYYAVFLLAGFLAGALASPAGGAYLRSPSPLISAVTAVIVLSPHIYWLYSTDFTLFHNIAAQLAATPVAEVLKKDAIDVAATLGYAALILAIWWIVVRPSSETWREAWRDPERSILAAPFVVPLALPAVLAPLIGLVLTPLMSAPGWFLLPILLLRPKSASLSRVAAVRLTALVAALTILALIAAPLIALQRHATGTADGREYDRQVAGEITNSWHLAAAAPLRIVMGDRNLVAAVAFYSPDQPDPVPDFDLASTPWVTAEDLQQNGYVIICTADDQNCTDEARRRVSGKDNVQFMNFATINRYLGRPGKLGRFFFILVAPETAPRIIIR
jgi:hypothetical protein